MEGLAILEVALVGFNTAVSVLLLRSLYGKGRGGESQPQETEETVREETEKSRKMEESVSNLMGYTVKTGLLHKEGAEP